MDVASQDAPMRARNCSEVLVLGKGSSGIGTTAIQLAKAFGARVFATAGSAEKCAACEQLGAERAINYREEDFVAVVKEATEKKGVDLILDMVGGDYVQRNIKALAVDGRLGYIAFLGGSKVEVNLMPIMLKRLTYTGSTLRSRPDAFKTRVAEELRSRVWPLFEQGSLRPVVGQVFPLAEAVAAHTAMEQANHRGKLVLVP